MAPGFLRAGKSPGPELTPLLESVTSEEALCHRTALLVDYPELTWRFLSQQFPRSVFYLLRQPNTTALAKQSTKYERTEGRGRSAFKLFWPIMPRMEKVLSENSSNQFDEVSEEIFSGLQSEQMEFDHLTESEGSLMLWSAPAHGGVWDRGIWPTFRLEEWPHCQSSPKFSKTTIETNMHGQNIFHPFPQTPGTGSNIYPGFPHHPHPRRGQREDQSTGNGKTSRGKHFPYNVEYF